MSTLPSLRRNSGITSPRRFPSSIARARGAMSGFSFTAPNPRWTLNFANSAARSARSDHGQCNVTGAVVTATRPFRAHHRNAVCAVEGLIRAQSVLCSVRDVFSAAPHTRPQSPAVLAGNRSADSSKFSRTLSAPCRAVRALPLFARTRQLHTREGFYSAAAGGSSAPNPSPTTPPKEHATALSVLVAAVLAALNFLPQNCPARPLCVAALAAQQALTNHGE